MELLSGILGESCGNLGGNPLRESLRNPLGETMEECLPRGNIGEFLGESLGNPGGTLRKSLGGLLGEFLGGILGESLGEISCNINK